MKKICCLFSFFIIAQAIITFRPIYADDDINFKELKTLQHVKLDCQKKNASKCFTLNTKENVIFKVKNTSTEPILISIYAIRTYGNMDYQQLYLKKTIHPGESMIKYKTIQGPLIYIDLVSLKANPKRKKGFSYIFRSKYIKGAEGCVKVYKRERLTNKSIEKIMEKFISQNPRYQNVNIPSEKVTMMVENLTKTQEFNSLIFDLNNIIEHCLEE
jgi:hypothetical protein